MKSRGSSEHHVIVRIIVFKPLSIFGSPRDSNRYLERRYPVKNKTAAIQDAEGLKEREILRLMANSVFILSRCLPPSATTLERFIGRTARLFSAGYPSPLPSIPRTADLPPPPPRRGEDRRLLGANVIPRVNYSMCT